MTPPHPSLNSASAEARSEVPAHEKPRDAAESSIQVAPRRPRRLTRPDARTRAESIKRSCRIEEVVMSQGVLLRVVGDGHHLVGLCPFHQEERGSFTVYPDTQSFCCFGCHAAGDVITFICLLRQVSFTEALQILGEQPSDVSAQTALQVIGEPENPYPDGVLAPPAPLTRRRITSNAISAMKSSQSANLSTSMQEAPEKGDDTNAQNALAQTLLWFTQVLAMQGLARTPGALTYLGERGISYALAQRCHLGYLADDVLASLLVGNPTLEHIARQIGLLNRGGHISLLRRLIVPEIRCGQTMQLIGRVVPGLRTPMAQNKYHLVCGTGEKHLLGYGAALQRLARHSGGGERRFVARRQRQEVQGILVLEGALDYVIAAGWDLPVLPVALLSTYPSRRQLTELQDLQQRAGELPLLLYLDGDDPGREATARLARILDERQVRYRALPPLPRAPGRSPSYKDLGEIGPLGLVGRAQMLVHLEQALMPSPAIDTFSPSSDTAATSTTPATHDELATLSNAPNRQEGGC
ncbi:MAG TPA: CHC2 zinc finger domain-containing protein [Ktedonobacterales bacterium]|nr:CHC2 zinc finger domain-containing protein [Ktedonobacterales bacterium]